MHFYLFSHITLFSGDLGVISAKLSLLNITEHLNQSQVKMY